VSVRNNLDVALSFCTRSLVPNDNNDETFALDIRAARRMAGPDSTPVRVVRRPDVRLDPRISFGARCHAIAPGAELAVRTDLRKWTIDGGWRPGRYAVSMQVTGLTPEGDPLTRIESTTDAAEFELR
jgi:hypothetical protein